jgi:hypothetical protein
MPGEVPIQQAFEVAFQPFNEKSLVGPWDLIAIFPAFDDTMTLSKNER